MITAGTEVVVRSAAGRSDMSVHTSGTLTRDYEGGSMEAVELDNSQGRTIIPAHAVLIVNQVRA